MPQTQRLEGSAHPADCRLIVDSPASGAQNMAADEALLLDAAESGVATLRFYEWSEPTLSLGYFQRHEDRRQHAASRDCAAVRRQTGGGAILHDCELTYSIILPASHAMARNSRALYTALHDAFIDVLSPLLPAASAAWSLQRFDPCAELDCAQNQESFLCFARRACGDVLLVGSNERIAKIVGSAQRRHAGAILQHGSLLLEKSPFAPELAGWRDLTGVPIAIAEVIDALQDRIATSLGLRVQPAQFPVTLQSNAARLTNNKYGTAAWTNRR